MEKNRYRDFYEKVFWVPARIPKDPESARDPSFEGELSYFIERFGLRDKKVLEVGSGSGSLQDFVSDYTGLDIVGHLKVYYRKPFFTVNDDGTYPFGNGVFDAIFTRSTLEHVLEVDAALNEMLRVLKPGGVIFLHAAWQVRPWAAEGYAVRPWSDFGLRGKLVKLSVPLWDSVPFRLLYVVPKRLWRTAKFVVAPRHFARLDYRKIKANYDVFWCADSDACNLIDPHAVILWFKAHGCGVINYPTLWSSFFVRTGSILIKKLL